MIDDRIKRVVERIYAEKPAPARAQRMIENVVLHMRGDLTEDDVQAERDGAVHTWRELRDVPIEGLTMLRGEPFKWRMPPAEDMAGHRAIVERWQAMGQFCDCPVCRELNQPIIMAASVPEQA